MAEVFCANCNEKIFIGLLKANDLLPDNFVETVNLHFNTEYDQLCSSCGKEAFEEARVALVEEMSRLRKSLAEQIDKIPILSIQHPMDWQYQSISIVTAQSVTGTGLFSDITSSWTDFFGTQSGSYNNKIRAGEEMCKQSLRLAALEIGCNAIIAADVDYAEVGGASAMLMVCMTGTAIKLKNGDVLGPGRANILSSNEDMFQRLKILNPLKLYA